MSYLPYAPEEQGALLATVGVLSVNQLFDNIPQAARVQGFPELPTALSEQELLTEITMLAGKNNPQNARFLGAGLYDHFIPAAVNALVSRSEFVTAYTPYQPEISQGTLMAIFEFQTYMARLTGLPVSNASLYDGATAACEAMAMAAAQTRKKEILVSRATHPHIRQTMQTYARFEGLTLREIPFDAHGQSLAALSFSADTAAVVVQSPNFFGVLEPMAQIAALTEEKGCVPVAVCDPLSLGLLTPPGALGFDIAVGDCQPLGMPPRFGGPSAGYLTAGQTFLRRLPGRVVGETVDTKGNRAFVLTLQAREQHIRREKATSNICSNQAHCALTATVYLSLMGPRGLRAAAGLSAMRAARLRDGLVKKRGAAPLFDAPYFREFAVTPAPGDTLSAGLALGEYYPELSGAVLLCATETASDAHIDAFVEGRI